MHLGRIFALLAIVSMTLLTFASCGPLEFKGHHLLVNELDPDESFESASRELQLPTQPQADGGPTLFEGSDAWLHWVYLLAFVFAVVSLVAPVRMHTGTGLAGLCLVAVFMFGFDAWWNRKVQGDGGPHAGPVSGMADLDFEVGAWLALAGFAGVAFTGFRSGGAGGSRGFP